MFNIQTLNAISPAGLQVLPDDRYTISDSEQQPDAILVRSANMHDTAFGENLLAIGRAGAGVNNIPLDRCSKQGIAVFNTPGGNANAVKELVVASMLLSSRDILGGIRWADGLAGTEGVAKAVEAGKKNFAGNEIYGKKLGVIGLGAIGVLVANAATDLGMEVYGVDPYISVESAWNLRPAVKKIDTYDQLADCDFISLHLPLVDETKEMVNEAFLKKLKDGVVILNFARGDLASNKDIITALETGKIRQYITDFPQDDTVGVDGIMNIPHLGASTEESEENCARMAAREVKHFLEFGNIINSVNFPDCVLPYTGKTRLTIIHNNVPTIISKFLDGIAKLGVNIANMINKSKDDIAYTIIDLDDPPSDDVVNAINALEDVIRIRVI